jgi:hypothetical protein
MKLEFINSGKIKGFLADFHHMTHLCSKCAGTCTKYAFQQLCIVTSNLEIFYWIISSILTCLTAELQISPHMFQIARCIYVTFVSQLKPMWKGPSSLLQCQYLRCSCVRWLMCAYCGDLVVMGGCRCHHTGWDHLGTVPQSLLCLVFTQ